MNTAATRRLLSATAARRLANLRDRLFDADALVQSGKTPHEIIHQDDIVRLRYYPPLREDSIQVGDTPVAVSRERHAVPLVLVSPLAVNMTLYDLFPQRSLVRYLLARGFSVYLIDWGRPGARQDHWTLATYITRFMPQLLECVRAHAGTRTLSLHGWSFGGLFSYAYTAWSGDPDIRNLALLGAPCDYHDNGLIGQQYRRLSRLIKRLDLRPHATSPRWWRSPGWLNSALYKVLSPVASIRPHIELLGRLDDREQVAAHATNSAFLDDMVSYPGAVVQDIMQYLWTDNVLAEGRLPVTGTPECLSALRANLLLVTGKTDPVVTTACSKRLLALAASEDRQLLEVSGGHMAIVAGSKAPGEIWPVVADWLAARSD